MPAPLSLTSKLLQPYLFKSNNIFYNIMFGFIIHNDVVSELPKQIQDIYTHDNKLGDNTFTQEFYSLITDCCPRNEFRRFSATTEFQNAFYNTPAPLFSGPIILRNGGTKNKVLNSRGRNVPSIWLEKYDKNSDTKIQYCTSIAWVMQYYYMLKKSSYGKTRATKITPAFKISDSYIEYYSLTPGDKNGLEKKTGIPISSFMDLAKYIHSAIQDQVLYFNKIGIYSTIDQVSDSEENAYKREATLNAERKQFITFIDCYGNKNIDRFNALKRLAETNTFCANELGRIYYYGNTFYSNENVYEIKRDYAISANYFNLCITDKIVNPAGCWSLGDMILQGKYTIANKDRLSTARELFEKCGKYGPAKNSIAKIERELADTAYKKYAELLSSPNVTEQKSTEKLSKLKEEAVEHYIKALNYAYDATNYGWLYAYNNIYSILSSEAIRFFHDDLIKHPEYVERDRLEMLRKAADMKNAWAMDRLACEIMGNENVTAVDRKEAHSLLVEAAKQNYPRALEHLGELF